jgi:hypothetical protein
MLNHVWFAQLLRRLLLVAHQAAACPLLSPVRLKVLSVWLLRWQSSA